MVAQLVWLGAHGHAGQLHPRHHDFARRQVAELEELAQELTGLAAQQAALLALLDDVLNLLGRVIALGLHIRALDPDLAQDAVGHAR